MAHVTGAGFLRGRPFGGVAALTKDSLRLFTVTVVSEDRFCVIKIGNLLLCNVYLPCVGTPDRSRRCNSTLLDIWSYRELYPDCECLITGDFNVKLAVYSDISASVNNFIQSRDLCSCDIVFNNNACTYVNDALNHQSIIDYSVYSNVAKLISFEVIDPR